MWSLRRLPKLQEAPRPKSHWDYLLEEMQWMATDFAQERRWKLAAAKKVGLLVVAVISGPPWTRSWKAPAHPALEKYFALAAG